MESTYDPDKHTRVAVYIRTANKNAQGGPNSLAAQRAAATAFFEGHGDDGFIRTAYEYCDQGVSGHKTGPAWLSLIDHLRKGAFDLVFVNNLERLSRDRAQLMAKIRVVTGLHAGILTGDGLSVLR